MDKYKIEVEVLDDGEIPFKAHKTDAGFDLFATEDVTIYPNHVTKHPLNIKMKLPQGTYAQITSKSGLGSKGLLVYAGIIDESYRGIPHVVCTKLNGTHWHTNSIGDLMSDSEPIMVRKGQKLAQLIMHPYSPEYYMEKVDEIDTNTERGEGGFGSTGA
jgi:dUTP pyrophosphatase